MAILAHLLLCLLAEGNGATMACPYLKEVVMLYCQAYPIKKLVPLDRIASADPCLSGQFDACPLYKDVVTRIRASSQRITAASSPDSPRKEVFR